MIQFDSEIGRVDDATFIFFEHESERIALEEFCKTHNCLVGYVEPDYGLYMRLMIVQNVPDHINVLFHVTFR